jgi:hypothetical protein
MNTFDIEGMRYHVSSEVGRTDIEDYNFRITGKYNGIYAEVECSYRTIYGDDVGYQSSTNMRMILKNLAMDLGVEVESDQTLKWLLGLFWGEIVNTWHRRDVENEYAAWACDRGTVDIEGPSLSEFILAFDKDQR